MDRYVVRAALFLSCLCAATLARHATGAALPVEHLPPAEQPLADASAAIELPALSNHPTSECPRRAELPYHIRTPDCVMATAVLDGSARSVTLQGLLDRVAALKGIVYLESGYITNPITRRTISGALQHRMLRAGEFRLVWIKVAPEPGDRPMITIAHELQHVIELLESSATTEAEIDAYFERIGSEAGAWIVETSAAIEIERIVTRELSATPR